VWDSFNTRVKSRTAESEREEDAVERGKRM